MHGVAVSQVATLTFGCVSLRRLGGIQVPGQDIGAATVQQHLLQRWRSAYNACQRFGGQCALGLAAFANGCKQ